MSSFADDRPVINIDGTHIPVRIRVNRRAKRLILKVDTHRPAIDLTCPSKRTIPEGLQFARERHDWIRDRLAEAPARQPFVDKAHIPLRGIAHEIIHTGDRKRGVVCLEETRQILVGGEAAYLPRRIEDWLRKEARREFCLLADEFTDRLKVTRRRICVRDTKTRWGSCSSEGSISFSWRLIMAPPPVYRYVVAHEVAHLKHMDHSKDFWAVVDTLIEDRKIAQAWLAAEGASLYGFGGEAEPPPASNAA